MSTVWHDIRYGLRMLWKAPTFTTIALITLAVGIGANTIMFSVIDALLIARARKIKAPEQLAYCTIQGAESSDFQYAEYQALQDSDMAFSNVLAQIGFHDRGTLVRGGSAWDVWTTYVSANFFSVLGTVPAQGRGFLPEEDRPGSAPVAVLSYRYWRRMGSDPNLVGNFVSVNGVRCQIVGVAPKDFTGVALESWDLWLPLGSIRTVHKFYRSRPKREPRFYVVGRLKPEVTMAAAQAQVQALVPRFKQEYPQNWPERSSIHLRPPGRGEIPEDPEQNRRMQAAISLVLMSPAVLILVIACLNLANMLIVQGAGRHREIAIRMALGGGRWRIVRQLLVESLLLAVLGGGLGILLAVCGARILNVWIAATPNAGLASQFGLNVRVLVVTLGVCLTAALLFGLRPALLLSRRDIAGEMKTAGARVLGSLRRKRGSFSVAGQIALAVVLVLSATLLTRSALRIARPDPRFPLADKLVVKVDPIAGGYDETHSIQACAALADHLAALPEVAAVGTSYQTFFGGGGFVAVGEYRPEGGEDGSSRTVGQQAAFISVGRNYFEAMELPLLRGRRFDQHDHLPNAEKVAIIDDSLAYKLRPDGNALDCLVQWKYLGDRSDPYRVVGIVAHLPGIEDGEIRPQVYTALEADTWARCLCLHMGNQERADFLREQIAREIRQFDPRMPVLSVTTLAQERYNDSSVLLARFGARLGLAAGAAALFLAALGIYAIKGYMVAARTPEIGIRMALGATQKNVMGMVLREGFLLTFAGLIVGLALGLAVAKVAARLLYGINPLDPVSIIITLALLGVASLLAGYLPARRAAKVDPMEALRYE